MREKNALDDDAALDAIEKRAAAATPGPWHHSQTSCTANAAFIAAARTDVPALVTAVREARRAAKRVAAGHAVKVNATTVVVVCAGDEFLPAAREMEKAARALDAAREARTAADRRADEAQRQLATLVAENAKLRSIAQYVIETVGPVALINQVAEGGLWVDTPTGEWMCPCCGEYGDGGKDDIEHAKSCEVVEALAILGGDDA